MCNVNDSVRSNYLPLYVYFPCCTGFDLSKDLDTCMFMDFQWFMSKKSSEESFRFIFNFTTDDVYLGKK